MILPDARVLTDRLRGIPLDAVLRACGATQDPCDKAKWHTPLGVLSVNGLKFINWNLGKGGGGAIDLAMHLQSMSFRSAIAWLAHQFAAGSVLRISQPPRTRFMLPQQAPDLLPCIKRYLCETRRLPTTMVEHLIQIGKIFADTKANAVFLLMAQDQQTVGAELRGTSNICWRGLAPGSHKDQGFFSAGPDHSTHVILCESAIDAISCGVLYPKHQCISCAGARPNPAWLVTLLSQGCHVACGFDADLTGDNMADAMIARHPSVKRLRPSAHDWNDLLVTST